MPFDMKAFAVASLTLFVTLALLSATLNAQPAPVIEGAALPDANPAGELAALQQRSAREFDSLGDPLPEGALLRLGTVRFRHPSNVVDIALSPDEKTVVSIGRELIAWDAATGQERWRADAGANGINVPGAAYGIRPLRFSPDGQFLWTPGGGGQVNRWEVATGRVETLKVGQSPADEGPLAKVRMLNAVGRIDEESRSIDVAPDGGKLAIGSGRGVVVCDAQGIILYEIANRPAAPVKIDAMNNDRLLFGGDYCSGQFSPDGALLAVVGSDAPQEIKLINSQNGQEVRRVVLTSRLVRLAFSPDGRHLATTERDNAVRLYDVESGQELWSHVVPLKNQFENYTSAISFSPDGQQLAAAATDNLIHLLDAKSGASAGQLTGHTWYPWALAYSADGQTLFSSGWDGAVRRWDMSQYKQRPLPQGVRATGVVAVSPDGATLAYGDDAGTIRLVAAQDGAEQRTFELLGASFSQVVFSPDGAQLAGGGAHGDNVHAAVWNLTTGAMTHRWDWPKGRDSHAKVEAIAFSPDGSRLAVAVFRQSLAVLWDLVGNREIARLQHPEIYGLAFSPGGTSLATVGWDSTIRLWDPASGALSQTIDAAKAAKADGDLRMYAVCFAPVGNTMATAHMDGEVWVWNVADMTRRNRFGLRGSFAYGAMSFSPDGLWLATGLSSGRVSLWDASSGAEVWNRTHQDHVYAVAFRNGSTQVVSGADDGVCYVWQVNSQDPPPNEVDGERLWKELASDNGKSAYRAMSHLATSPGVAVPLLAEKLRTVETLLDAQEVDEAASVQESRRIRRLKKLLVEKDERVEQRITYHRAVALLAQIGTPTAVEVLQELAAKDSQGEVSTLAAAALKTIRPGREALGGAGQ